MSPALRDEIEALAELSVPKLKAKYVEAFGEQSRSGNAAFLRKRIAWRLQARAVGGLSERARRRAEELADEARPSPPVNERETPRPRPGVEPRTGPASPAAWRVAAARVPGNDHRRASARGRLRIRGPTLRIAQSYRSRGRRQPVEWLPLLPVALRLRAEPNTQEDTHHAHYRRTLRSGQRLRCPLPGQPSARAGPLCHLHPQVHGGGSFTKTTLHSLLRNPLYAGKVRSDGSLHPGEHEAIVDEATWRRVQRLLHHNGHNGRGRGRYRPKPLLQGLLYCQPCGMAMTQSVAVRRKRRYRYYVCLNAQKNGWASCPTKSVSAEKIEASVVERLRGLWTTAGEQASGELGAFGEAWDTLTPATRHRAIRQVVERIDYDGPSGKLTAILRDVDNHPQPRPVEGNDGDEGESR